MNMASNILGMGNAATPFGLKAMSELAKLNRHSGSASNAMVLFLAINASAITLLPPLGTIGVRAAANSVDPWAIWMPTLFATICSTARRRHRLFPARSSTGLPRIARSCAGDPTRTGPSTPARRAEGRSHRRRLPKPEARLPRWLRSSDRVGVVLWLLFFVGSGSRSPLARPTGWIRARFAATLLQVWTLPLLLLAVLLYGFAKRVRIYDSMVAGGREALDVALRIVPYLVVILVAVAMFRASGALDFVIGLIDPVTSQIGVPGRGAADGPDPSALGERGARRDERDLDELTARTRSSAC